MENLPLVDILKVFNSPISEEQSWAVCYQCAHVLANPIQEFYQDICDNGLRSIWISRHGDVIIRKGQAEYSVAGQNSQKDSDSPATTPTSPGVPSKHRRRTFASETDAVRALGMVIFEALDYCIDPAEERPLSRELEHLIAAMTEDNPTACDPEASCADDEGIEKDADAEQCFTFQDVIKMCQQHLCSKQDSQHHYKAVCRALAMEASELFTFLDKIASSKEKLLEEQGDDATRLEELQRADWACLWVQIMRSLRQGVCLKKVEHVNLPPVEYELTPFEMLLNDIRYRRYTLHRIMINGDIPFKVKDNAQTVILDFIRSRPPLRKSENMFKMCANCSCLHRIRGINIYQLSLCKVKNCLDKCILKGVIPGKQTRELRKLSSFVVYHRLVHPSLCD